MRIAIAEPDPAIADLLAFVAQRRGHQTVCLSGVDRMFEHLPFQPMIGIISFSEIDDAAVHQIRRLRERFEQMTLLVTIEAAKDPAPTRALRAGAHDVVAIPYNPTELVLRAETWFANRKASAGVEDRILLSDLVIDLAGVSEWRDDRGSGSVREHDQPSSKSASSVKTPRRPCSHRPAVSAPAAKTRRSRATWRSVMVSYGASSTNSCSPGMAPARTDVIGQSRVGSPARAASCKRRPVPDGASRLAT